MTLKSKTHHYRSVMPLIMLGVLLLSLSCRSKSDPSYAPVTLKIWKPFVDSQKLDPLIQQYQQQYPNVTIEYTTKKIETYQEDLLNALAARQGPDIFSINNSWLPKYIDKIEPAPDKYLTFRDYKESFVDVMVQDFTRDNKIYGVALGVDSLALYYNKDLLGTAGIATPPKTWNELASDVQKITRQDRTGYFTRSGVAMGTNSNVNRSVDIVYLLMLQAGAVPWSQDRLTPTFTASSGNTNPGETAVAFYTSFASPNSPNYTWNSRSDYSIDAFANGRSAFLYSYPYARAYILQKSPNLNFDVAPVPQRNLDNTSVNYANYFGEVVSKQSENSGWAWHFLKFISSKESLDKLYAENKQPSSRKDLISLQIQDPNIGVFANANLTAKSFYKPDETRIDDIFGKLIDNIVLQGMSVGDALSQAEQQAGTLTQNFGR